MGSVFNFLAIRELWKTQEARPIREWEIESTSHPGFYHRTVITDMEEPQIKGKSFEDRIRGHINISRIISSELHRKWRVVGTVEIILVLFYRREMRSSERSVCLRSHGATSKQASWDPFLQHHYSSTWPSRKTILPRIYCFFIFGDHSDNSFLIHGKGRKVPISWISTMCCRWDIRPEFQPLRSKHLRRFPSPCLPLTALQLQTLLFFPTKIRAKEM